MSDKEEEKKQGEIEQNNEDQDDNIDANVFNQNTDLVDTSVQKEFTVTNPQNKNGHIVYKCKGVDFLGVWEGERRYNEFYKLYEKLE